MDPENTNNNESMRMDHTHAARIQACTRYLVGGLSAEESEAFEEHFFSCQECSEELKAADVLASSDLFASSVRAVFSEESRRAAAQGFVARVSEPTWLDRFRMSFVLPVAVTACALLCFVIYQNTLLIPSLRTEVASLSEPQPVSWVPLKLARGNESSQLTKNPFWMAYFDLPKSGQFSSYFCVVERSTGSKPKTVILPAPAPGQPFSFLLRRSEYPSGAYVFKIGGNSGDKKVLATYTLTLKD
jgi:hypothetical protein